MATRPFDTVGSYLITSFGGEKVRSYIPKPLPPTPQISPVGMHSLLDVANQAVGRLDGLTNLLPDLGLFLYFYVRKEAVLSSQIEGTQSSISELLMYEHEDIPGALLRDVTEVSNYVASMNHGLTRMHDEFPLSLRLICEMHAILLSKGRGSEKQPGEFRRSQNWIGGTRPGNALFVPPPPEKVMELMGALELFIHNDQPDLPLLLKIAMIHLQFETIHPFLDGNGRIGRVLIPLLLCANKVLREPILYMSLYFKQHRSTYYELLENVRQTGDWEIWGEFFLEGVRQTADDSALMAHQILTLFAQDKKVIEGLRRPAASALLVYQYMQRNPIVSIPTIAGKMEISEPTVAKSIGHLQKLGILKETTGKMRRRIFVYDKYLEILNRGTEVEKR